MANLIGSLRATLGLDDAQYQAGLTRAERRAATSGKKIQKSLSSGVATGLTALTAGISVGLLTGLAKRALDYAASLGEVAQQLGVTTRDLQTFRYAAGQAGISQEEMDKGLAKLTVTLGKAQLGSKTAAAAFGAIGLSLDDLKGKNAGEAIRMVADALSKVKDPAQRAAVEVALFGRAGQKLDTLLSGGSKAIDELANAAEKLGIVLSDEQIQKADETADKLDQLKMVLEARIAGVVADNATSILSLATSLAELAAGIARFWSQNPERAFGILGAVLGGSIGARIGPLGAAVGAGLGYFAGTAAAPDSAASKRQQAEMFRQQAIRAGKAQGYVHGRGSAKDRRILQSGAVQANLKQVKRLLAEARALEQSGSIAAPATGGGGGGGSVTPFLGGGGRGGGGRKSKDTSTADAERLRKQQLRDEYQFATDQRRNQIDILQAQSSLSDDYSERTTLAIQIIDLEKKQEEAAIQLAVGLGDMTEPQAKTLKAQLNILDSLKRQEVMREEEDRRLKEMAELDRLDLNLQQAQLESERQLATTAKERRAVELKLLDLAYAEEKLAIEQLKASRDHKDQEEGRRREAAMGKRYANDKTAVMKGTMGPIESYLDGIPNTAAEANEALEMVAAKGLQSLEDGLVDILMGTKSVAQAFRQMAASIIADLIRIQIQKMLSGMLGGVLGGAVGGGNVFGAMPTGGAIGMARGGSFGIGGKPGVDMNLLSINGQPIARVSKGETGFIVPNNDNVRGSGPVNIHINAPMTEKQARQTGMQVAAGYRSEMARAARRGY